MAEEPAIDPRYDPAFQRGFDGTTPPATASPSHRATPHATSALQRPVSEPRPHAVAPAEPRERIGLPPPTPGAEPEPETTAAPAPVAGFAASPARAPWRNPFAIAVAVIGIAVLALGIWLLQETYQLTQSEGGFSSQADYWFLQWGMIGGPIFAGLGVAILVAVLVLCAVHWAHRPVDDVE